MENKMGTTLTPTFLSQPPTMFNADLLSDGLMVMASWFIRGISPKNNNKKKILIKYTYIFFKY